jgi:hypothetical protein
MAGAGLGAAGRAWGAAAERLRQGHGMEGVGAEGGRTPASRPGLCAPKREPHGLLPETACPKPPSSVPPVYVRVRASAHPDLTL